MTEELIQNYQRLLSTLDIKMVDSLDTPTHTTKTIASINNIETLIEYLEIINRYKDDYIEWVNDSVWRFDFKEEALLFLRKQQISFDKTKASRYHCLYVDGKFDPERKKMFWLYADEECKELLYEDSHTDMEIRVFCDIYRTQINQLKDIKTFIEELIADVKIHSKGSWNKKRRYDGSNPWITIGEDFKLTDPDANFKSEIDRHQAVLLFHYFQQANIFYPYTKPDDIVKLRYYLTGHSSDYFRKNKDSLTLESIKKDSTKNSRKKSVEGFNLSSLHKKLSEILSMIEEDQELYKEKIRHNNQ
jgi:hypothetical protein